MKRWKRFLVLALLIPLMVGCESIFGLADVGSGQFQMEVSSLDHRDSNLRLVDEFQGDGSFKEGLGQRKGFSIWSDGLDRNQGEQVIIRWYGSSRPGTGVYKFDLFEPDALGTTLDGLTGQYTVARADGALEAFFIDGGTVSITDSGSDVVRGSFHATGVRWCVRHPDGSAEGCDDPRAIPSDSPRSEVSGSFVAVPKPVGIGCTSRDDSLC